MATILISGANGNLGTAVTRTFLQKDYRVAAAVYPESAKATMPSHPNLDVQVVNLSDEAAAGSYVHSVIERTGQVDAALLLAGGFAPGKLETTGKAELQQQISLNFETAYFLVRPLFAHMMQRNKGRIVLVGARPALVASQGKNAMAYALSKSLLFKLAEFLNAEASGKNVTVTVVAPSTLDTPPNRQSMPNANPADWVKPEQLAEILEFVVSDKGGPLRETVLKVYNNA